MLKIDLKNLSQLASDKIGKKIVFNKIEKIGSGYHSDGFKVSTDDGESFFLKYVRSQDLGFEFPERQIMTLMVSDGMGKRTKNKPASIGVIIDSENNEGIILPEIDDSTKIYHLQEFSDGESISYSEILRKNISKKEVGEEDIKQLNAIADILVKIHSVKHSSNDKKRLTAIYNDGIRNTLIHPELSIMALSEFPIDYEVLDLEGQKEIISLMYGNIKEWTGRHDRLSALHGDFWGANIFFGENEKPWVIDFSRIPWGDPAIDVGWFIAENLWYYNLTGNDYFKDLAEKWLDIYQEKTGDTEVRKALPLILGWTGIVQVYPRFFPDIDVEVGKKFISHIKEILRRKELFW